MSDFNFYPTGDYLKLAYTSTGTLTKPAGVTSSTHNFTLDPDFTDTGYTPVIKGIYADQNGVIFPMKTVVYNNSTPLPLSPIVLTMASSNSLVQVRFHGDLLARTAEYLFYIFMESVTEVT